MNGCGRTGRYVMRRCSFAIGVGENDKRRVLGMSVAVGEHEVHGRRFLTSLVERGLTGVQLMVSVGEGGKKLPPRNPCLKTL